MPSRRSLLKSASAAVALSMSLTTHAWAEQPIPVVASFSILGDMVERIGGDHVAVTTLVGRDGDAHVYQPTPQDARAVSEAQIMVINGLEFEGWLERLTEAASFDGTEVVATKGIEPIAFEDGHGHGHHDDHDDHHHDEEHATDDHDHGHADAHAEDDHGDDHSEADHDHDAEHAEKDHEHGEEHAEAAHDDHTHDDHGHDDHAGHDHGAFDPHAWLSPTLAVTYVDNITAALAQADPSNAGTFYENRAAYVAEIEALNSEIAAMMAGLPEDRRTVVTSHDAFQYFGREYNLTFEAPQGLSTESEASAQDVARLIEHMREEGISAVFLENIADSRLLEQIASETGASIGGTLYPGALSEEDGPAPTYLDLLRHNATTIAQALEP